MLWERSREAIEDKVWVQTLPTPLPVLRQLGFRTVYKKEERMALMNLQPGTKPPNDEVEMPDAGSTGGGQLIGGVFAPPSRLSDAPRCHQQGIYPAILRPPATQQRQPAQPQHRQRRRLGRCRRGEVVERHAQTIGGRR